MTGVYVLIAALLVTLAFGLFRRARDGRSRTVSDRHGRPTVTADQVGEPLGTTATLLQFSSETCTPCRATRRLLGSMAAGTPGLAHIEVDAEQRLDLAEEFGVLRTPTVLVLDRAGVVRQRMVGAPRRADVDEALAASGVPQRA